MLNGKLAGVLGGALQTRPGILVLGGREQREAPGCAPQLPPPGGYDTRWTSTRLSALCAWESQSTFEICTRFGLMVRKVRLIHKYQNGDSTGKSNHCKQPHRSPAFCGPQLRKG